MIENKPKYILQIVTDYESMCQEILEQFQRVQGLIQSPVNEEVVSLIGHHERVIDSMEVKLHNDIMRSIVLYTPRASESRQIISYYDMAGNLERIGDLLVNIMGYLQQVSHEGEVYISLRENIEVLYELVHDMVRTAIFAFSCGDVAAARDLISNDDRVDDLYRDLTHLLPQRLLNCSGVLSEVDSALQIFGLGYCLERIGDHASNIAEATIYTYEGTFLKHQGNAPRGTGKNEDSDDGTR